MREQIVKEIAGTLKVSASKLTDDDGIGITPDWDSLMHLQICMQIESRFAIAMDLDRIAQLKTVADFIAAVEGER